MSTRWGVRAGWDALCAAICGIMILLAAFAAAAAIARPAWAIGGEGAAWWLPTPGNLWFALALGASAIGAYAVYWLPRRTRFWRASSRGIPSSVFGAIVWSAAVSGALGFAAFLPCTEDALPVLTPATRTLLLFVGALDVSAIGPDAATCAGAAPAALQLAQFGAIATTFLGAATALFAVSRDRLARWRVHRSADVDVVVGLDALSMPLVAALVAERDERHRRTRTDRWLRRRPRDWLLWSRPTQIAVVHPVRGDAAADEAAATGAVVIVGDPRDERVLRPILTGARGPFGRRAARSTVRRLFAVAEDQQANLDVVETARRLLGALAPAGSRPATREVPRLVARLDDSREARDWRIEHADDGEAFADAFAVDDLIAAQLCDRLVAAGIRRLVVVGDAPLASAILDELVWRAWVAEALGDDSPTGPWVLDDVLLAGVRSDRVEAEWRQRAAPAAFAPSAPRVRSEGGDWEIVAGGAAQTEAAAVIVCESGGAALTRATRLARRHPSALVMASDPTAAGPERLRRGAVMRFGPTLLRDGRAPEDTWTRLARFRHQTFAPDGTRAARRAWDGRGDRVAAADRPLPEFFREDTLRQHRLILRAIAEQPGWRWRPVEGASGAARPSFADAGVVERIARLEHERWCDLRLSDGWSGDTDSTSESERLNRNLRDWETGAPLRRRRRWPGSEPAAAPDARGLDRLHEDNATAVRDILDALRAWGIAPVRTDAVDALPPADPFANVERFRRIGTVWAWRLDSPREWTGPRGDVLRGETGDWWVVSRDGQERTVAADAFAQTYEQIADQEYRRIGVVAARRATGAETVATREGATHPAAGDWIVTDAEGRTWSMPDGVFRGSHAPL